MQIYATVYLTPKYTPEFTYALRPWHSQKHALPLPQKQFSVIPSYTAVHYVGHQAPCHTHPSHTESHMHVYISTRHSSSADYRGLFPQSPPPHLPPHAHTPSLKGYGHSVIRLAYFRITLSSLKMKRDLLTVKQFCLTGMGL